MSIKARKWFAKKSIARSIALFTVCAPLLIGVVFKVLYHIPIHGDPVLSALLTPFKNIVASLYHSHEWVQFLWYASPTPNFSSIVALGNFLSIVVLLGLLWGIVSFSTGIRTVDELSAAKHNARKRHLEDQYRDMIDGR